MKIVLLVTYSILINIHESLEGKLNALKSVDACPMNEQAWKQKSVGFSCSEDMAYHCIFAKNESMYELCMAAKKIINKVGCPQINFYEDQILFDSSYSKCPPENKDCPKGNETYKTDSLYKFPACLQKSSLRTDFGERDKQTNANGTTTPKSDGKGETNNNDKLFVIIALLVFIIIIFIIALLWIKRKYLGSIQICRRITENSDNGQIALGFLQENKSELDNLLTKSDDDETGTSQSVDENDTGGLKENLKEGGIFDWTFSLKSSDKGMKLKKDGRDVSAGKKIVMCNTKEGYRLIIFQLTREDEGKYTCINTNSKEKDTVHLKVEKATRAIYHHECIKSLSSIPYILFFLQQAIGQAPHTDETPELKSSLDGIKKQTFQVLTLSYQNITRIQMLSRKTEAVHLNGISEALNNNRKTDISGKISRMAKDIQEGQKIIEETLVEVEKVTEVINSVESNFANIPTLSKDMSSCRVSLENLFVKWTSYKLFFSSVKFVIEEGNTLTGEQDEAALTPNYLEVLRIYVSSVGRSTQYYAEIYLDEIQDVVDKFYAEDLLEKDDVERLSQKIKDRYDEMYERDSRASEKRAIPYVKNTNIEEIE